MEHIENFEIKLINSGYIIGKEINGYIEIKNKSPLMINEIYYQITGTAKTQWIEEKKVQEFVHSELWSGYVTKVVEVKHDFNETFYQSPFMKVYDEKHNFMSHLFTTEIAPGIHQYPFKYSVPNTLPSIVSFEKEREISYKMIAFIRLANGNQFHSSPIPLYFCISQLKKERKSLSVSHKSEVIPIQLKFKNCNVNVGEHLKVTLKCQNLSNEIVNLKANIAAIHKYSNVALKRKTITSNLPPINPGKSLEFKFEIPIPITFAQTVEIKSFIVQTVFAITGMINGEKINLKNDINIDSYVTNTELIQQRISYFNDKETNYIEKQFYGIHKQLPPSYETIIHSDYPPGIEKVNSYKKDDDYFVFHFARNTTKSSDMSIPCTYPYPQYLSIGLPCGWSIGKYKNEMYFIDHNLSKTQWEDPIPITERMIPHIEMNKTATFEIEIIKGIGFPILGKSLSDCYACVIDNKQKEIRTETIKQSLDPIFETNNKLIVELDEKRVNVQLYFYNKLKLQKNKCIGSIEFDLQYFPPNIIIQDWFQLNCCGDESIPTTGKVLLKVCYCINNATELPEMIINGKTELNQDYYPNNEIMRNQIELQNTKRNELNLMKNPMKIIDDNIVCDIIE